MLLGSTAISKYPSDEGANVSAATCSFSITTGCKSIDFFSPEVISSSFTKICHFANCTSTSPVVSATYLE